MFCIQVGRRSRLVSAFACGLSLLLCTILLRNFSSATRAVSCTKYFDAKGRNWPDKVNPIRHVVFINLASRTDRLVSINHELRAARLQGRRLAAENVRNNTNLLRDCWSNSSLDVSRCAGQLGCQMSHIQALELAERSGWDHVAIFEDDFEWGEGVEPLLFQYNIASLMAAVGEWDVIAISVKLVRGEAFEPKTTFDLGRNKTAVLKRIIEAQTTHGYIVRAGYIPRVLKTFRACDVRRGYWTAIDTCWKHLQLDDKWFAFDPQLGTQAKGFSDIEQKQVSYMIQ